MITVSFEFGLGNERTKQFPPGTTFGQALKDANLQASLGYGANVAAHVQGEAQPDSGVMRHGMRVVIHDKVCEKQ